MTVSREEIAVMYREYMRRPFPPRLRGEDIDDIDFILLDSDISARVSTWLHSQNDLDPKQQRILRNCLDKVHRVLPALTDPTERHYFSALGDCAQAVLAAQKNPQMRHPQT